ncbi:hypothetical protein CC1G_02647 [Coprinopsis cinerea okayama7|uniref:DUF1996 domain-containing protein n=1 Tax=Coprinopsis cinerea (strain Okayama-7 / 130 / ATCC MYA-4618 / FGSC 9003) TaxID=240176 RepID=A8PBH5_COPC7|nr:hypothetical protein CC1G_02647 [Coprinopsis cinerea okayama7\|eukprot:XP_001840184.2 hypothetical protein CC1G_02647 [Coprinopsis cinerea okayama7\
MDPNNDLPKLATCTSCQVVENKSNYWTAVLFFKHTNGSFIRVPQKPNINMGQPNGGMTVYYVQNGGGKITAFPKFIPIFSRAPWQTGPLTDKPNTGQGFRMITGNPMLRSENTKVPPKVTSFRCLDETLEDFSGQPPGGRPDPVDFPKKPCPAVMRSQTYFPQCWDGVNIDSPDHASHIVHPVGPPDDFTGLNFYRGTCPASHPVRMPMILFETIWETRAFNDLWPTDGSQPFVYSMGDPTGYGHHGDYVFGWEGDTLQRAMDKCTDFNGDANYCKEFTVQPDTEMNKCALESVVDEVVDGYLDALPGCNPIQPGPEDATMVEGCTAVSTTKGYPAGPTPVPTSI